MKKYLSKIRSWHIGLVMASIGFTMIGYFLILEPQSTAAFAISIIGFFLILFGTAAVMGKPRDEV